MPEQPINEFEYFQGQKIPLKCVHFFTQIMEENLCSEKVAWAA
ncbi:hypothetical protein NT05HA_1292 [Aggregatibacter aphrophilus NJ8700]|uniref:Uncharacterized protein n=1 Tax=Aggregatibacter aphrophilus ATCC 33389 TaxID=985008 RepID=A0A3S4QT59_AGGAP|nr:hypothetical protein NT05HA_1292 [Aggregatibacter aphrophilus NJ8700]EHB91018.1 hypothetical protein HMPREF9335_00708 [Aggregatibacter aphrophilus F0387]SQI97343.1 Uncharacterised protein [Aggregatibacter aphrophilus]VEF44535.1 Uncharacterised protein [Aggregatibacter aphrophilus ATCC 33389]